MADFLVIYNARMRGVLRWEQLDSIWATVSAENGWYLYEIGAPLPTATIDADLLKQSISEIDQFLHKEHDEDYCGVVYADDLKSPNLLKIYHPKKMGASCGSSAATVLPKWTLSKTAPIDLLEWALDKDKKPSWWKHMLKKSA